MSCFGNLYAGLLLTVYPTIGWCPLWLLQDVVSSSRPRLPPATTYRDAKVCLLGRRNEIGGWEQSWEQVVGGFPMAASERSHSTRGKQVKSLAS